MLKEKAENIKYIPDWQTLDRILNAAATHLKPIILAALYTGFRKSTLLSLKWENIIGDEIIVKVKDSQYDGGKTVSQKLFPELRRLIFSQPKVSDYIFTYKGQRVKDIKTAWHSIFKKTGLPYVNFHTLRHTSGTWLLRETGNLKFVQKHLGHSSTKVTENTPILLMMNARLFFKLPFAAAIRNNLTICRYLLTNHSHKFRIFVLILCRNVEKTVKNAPKRR